MKDASKHNGENRDETEQNGDQQEFTFDENNSFGNGWSFKFWFPVVILLGIGAVVAGLYWSQSIKIDNIIVHGTHLADTEQIKKKAQFTVSSKRDSVSMLEVMDSVRQVNFVRSVDVSVNLDGSMELMVRERQPLALLADTSPKMWVDQDGVILPMLLENSINVPLLYGFSGVERRDTLDSAAFKKVRDFLTTAKKHPFTWSTLSEIRHHPSRGVIAVSGNSGMRLVFGSNDFERKMKYWKAYYGQVLNHKRKPDHRELDLRFEGQIVAR